MSEPTRDSITSILVEERTFPPPQDFSLRAFVSTPRLAELYDEANANVQEFWSNRARFLTWEKVWDNVLEWQYPHARWFTGGRINVAVNCVDRHCESGLGAMPALRWEGEDCIQRTFTYSQLQAAVCRLSNALQSLNVGSGDVVAIYMGMIPEAVIAMLACARIGAIHNVVFGGFSSEALRDRIIDSNAVCVITQDAAYRRGETIRLKDAVDTALQEVDSVKTCIVVRRAGCPIVMKEGRDFEYECLTAAASEVHTAIAHDAEHPLFYLYTSGSTGRPKGIVHTCGGYLVQTAWTFKLIFDHRADDVFFCTADIGWITGHSYVVYGPLANAATVVLYEGAPNYPDPGRLWEIIDRHGVTIFYTAPTAIRAFMKWGEQWPRTYNLDTLRLLGSVGEPINPEAWMWYYREIGRERCRIVDTWWQTETGAIMVSPVPGVTPLIPGTATQPLPGIDAEVVRRDGTQCQDNEGGYLVIQSPWPSMLRTILGDDERYQRTYWNDFPPDGTRDGWYFTGDGARRDTHGNIWIIGRVDDVVNISGHRLGTAEIESSLVAHPFVAEAAIVTRPDQVKGNALIAFVTLRSQVNVDNYIALSEELRGHVANHIGHIAKPDEVRFVTALPRTRSGKIMRRLLREIVATGRVVGDTTTLEDLDALEQLRRAEE